MVVLDSLTQEPLNEERMKGFLCNMTNGLSFIFVRERESERVKACVSAREQDVNFLVHITTNKESIRRFFSKYKIVLVGRLLQCNTMHEN